MKYLAILPAVLMLSAGCRSVTTPVEESKEQFQDIPLVVKSDRYVRDQSPLKIIPRAVIYKCNGNYDNNVPVMLNNDGTALVSYPAPTDLTGNSSPLLMADGWLLDRRGGVGLNTGFLDWTYDEYRSFKSAPSIEEIMAHLIPGARVTEVRSLPITAQDAMTDTCKVNQMIRNLTSAQ